MTHDPAQNAYALLSEFDVTPDTPQRKLLDLQLDRRLSKQANPEARASLNWIADLKNRLEADFFLPLNPAQPEGENQ